jgi:pantetheine-phosphate adenylyltransferase
MAASHALFPGTFDPFTLGHLDLVRRAAVIFPRLTVAVATHPSKQHLFDLEARLDLIAQSTAELPGVRIVAIEGLVVEAARRLDAQVIVRGVRSGTDLDYELAMCGSNRAMAPGIDTLLLAASPAVSHITGTLVRQIAAMGGPLEPFVPEPVLRALGERLRTG